NAVSRGDKPPFQPLADYYDYNIKQTVAKNLAPDEDRCAIALSLTLGLEPRPGEASLAQLGDRGRVDGIIHNIKVGLLGCIKRRDMQCVDDAVQRVHTLPEVTHAEIAKRY